MATIKIPYQYTSYPFSPKATKLSKRLAKHKMAAAVFVSMIMVFVFLGLTMSIVEAVNYNASPIILLFSLAAGIGCGIYAEKLRKQLYHKAIRKALEKDLTALFPGQPELVSFQLQMRTADLSDNKNGR